MKPFSSMIRLLFALVATTCFAALVPTGAGAESVFQYQVQNYRHYNEGRATVFKLDPSKSITIRVLRGMTVLGRDDSSGGATEEDVYLNQQLQPGDVVEAYQPMTADPVPDTAPVETFTVPELTGTLAADNASVTGNSGSAATVRVHAFHPCDEQGGDAAVFASVAGGSYSATLPLPPAVGSWYRITGVEPDGDVFSVEDRVPGDAFCVNVDGYDFQYEPVPYSEPFHIWLGGLDDMAIATTRIVLRRGAATIAEDDSTGIDLGPDQRPLPGDVVEIYRPFNAATPAYSLTLPDVSAVFDPGNDLVAVQAPAAKAIDVEACSAFDCTGQTWRSSGPVPAGRTFFSLAQPFPWGNPLDLQPDSQVAAKWYSSDLRTQFSVPAVPGDLTSPVGKITLAKKLKLKKIGKRIKFKLSSTEAGSLSAKLTTAAPKRRGKSKKQVTLGSTKTRPAKAGSNAVSLTVSKGGKKAIKKLIAFKKSQVATLTITLADASGNVTTVVKTVKLALK